MTKESKKQWIILSGIAVIVGVMIWATFSRLETPEVGLVQVNQDDSYDITETVNKQVIFVDGEVDTSDWETYRSEAFGFEIKHPQSWSVNERSYDVTFHDITRVFKYIEFDHNGVKATVGVKKKDADFEIQPNRTGVDGEFKIADQIAIMGIPSNKIAVGYEDALYEIWYCAPNPTGEPLPCYDAQNDTYAVHATVDFNSMGAQHQFEMIFEKMLSTVKVIPKQNDSEVSVNKQVVSAGNAIDTSEWKTCYIGVNELLCPPGWYAIAFGVTNMSPEELITNAPKEGISITFSGVPIDRPVNNETTVIEAAGGEMDRIRKNNDECIIIIDTDDLIFVECENFSKAEVFRYSYYKIESYYDARGQKGFGVSVAVVETANRKIFEANKNMIETILINTETFDEVRFFSAN